MPTEHFDVLIVGAGLSGIGAAYRLQEAFPGKRYAVLEGRARIGGTWDLFKYPGIRCDSPMHTLSYSFRPWQERKAIAGGEAIRSYIESTASEFGIDEHIRFKHRVRGAEWSTATQKWTVEVEVGDAGETCTYTCGFLFMCSGYYSYESGYMPDFPGSDSFEGRVVHAQTWPEDLDYRGKKVVVIGSGATAATLVPAMAEDAGHVTMLQRSPTYFRALPDEDKLANRLQRLLPSGLANSVVRWKNILLGIGFYQFCRRLPNKAKDVLLNGVSKQLTTKSDLEKHFTPTYNPWDQRICAIPNSDLFAAIGSNRASVVTDTIESFTENGIRLSSGQELAADIIVAATGLNLESCGGAQIVVDGEVVRPGDQLFYKGVMVSGIPNFAVCLGYTNAAWTLRADLSARYVCRVLKHMDSNGYGVAVPEHDSSSMERKPTLDLKSGYVQRGADVHPKQGSRAPWFLRQNYLLDSMTAKFSDIEESMAFSKNNSRAERSPEAAHS